MVATGEKATKAITDALWRLMRSRGRGMVVHVERSLGMPRRQIYKARDRGLRLSEVMAILEVLEVPPGPFFASVFGDGPTTAGDRFRADGSDLIARGIIDVPELASPTRPDTLTADELEALDRARFEDPRAAAIQGRGLAFLAASEGRQGDAAACAARWGSALRAGEQWHQAHAVVCWAINHAPEGPILADCWLRAASVTSDYGEFMDAAELARMAMLAFVEMGDDTGIGRALVSCGIFLRRAGDAHGAIRCLRSALAKLPDDEHHNRFACHLSMGGASVMVGDLGLATAHADEAQAIGASANWLAHLRWLRARVAAAHGNLLQAASMYHRTAEELEGSPSEAALIGVELARVYLRMDRPHDAVAVAKGLASLAMPRRANRLVSSAIRDLWRFAATGELTIRLLDRIGARVRAGRDRRSSLHRPRPELR